jgi:hypothetical protein
MTSLLSLRAALLAPTVALIASATFAAEPTISTIKFSDPAKPGTVRVSLGRGELRVQGADTQEISVKSTARIADSKPRKDGLRVISAASSFSLTEKNNTVVLDSVGHDWGRGSNSDFQLTVPRDTTVIVQNAFGGDITCSGIAGDIEINSMHGEIKLDDVSGGIVVGTMNGEIRANIRELREGKPLSFTSMNGEVVLRLPAQAKANVRLRTQNGSVLTDFDESVLATKAEAAPVTSRSKTITVRDSKVLSVEIQEAIREATAASATAVKEALEAVKQGLDEARLNTDEARRKVDEARRDMDRARREAERENRAVARARTTQPEAPEAPEPPSPVVAGSPAPAPRPKVPIPTITGGKLVTGTLNGGGPEISVSTMNGDVVLRKLEAK